MVKSCVLCGFLVAEKPGSEITTWVSQYRAVYYAAEKSEVLLSGIGIEDDPASDLFFVPRDPNARWDDKPSFQNKDLERAEESEQVVFGSEAFYSHASCWSLLERAYCPSPVPLRRFYEACRSLPQPLDASTLSWGDDYGGRLLTNLRDNFPWEDHWKDQKYPDGVPSIYYGNPAEDPEAITILEEPPSAPTTHMLQTSSQPGQASSTVSRIPGKASLLPLPVEICHQIAAYLGTSDALNVRLASKSFQDIFYSQSFWSSRFDQGGERSWLFEAHDTPSPPDWRYLYRRTQPRFLGYGLQNRRRVWKRLPVVMATLNYTGGEALQPCDTLADMDLECCRVVQGHVNEGERLSFNNGCRILYKQSVGISQGPLLITTYLVRLADADYVCGLKFSRGNDTDVHFGYQSPHALTDSVQDLQGFEVAVGSRGINGLRCVSSGQVVSSWRGNPTESVQTHRLTCLGGIEKIKGGFDGFKMLVLAALGSVPVTSNSDVQGLREAAVWYAEIPRDACYLNYDSSFPLEKYQSGFRPLFWSPFGGPGGSQLNNLTQIRGIIAGKVLRIEFFYQHHSDTEAVQAHTFGRHIPSKRVYDVTFLIDGLGGERVTGVDVIYQTVSTGFPDYKKVEKMKGCKFHTNQQRTCIFQPAATEKSKPDKITCRSVEVRPDTVITGLFGGKSVDFSVGPEVIGVISEPERLLDVA